MGDPGFNLQDYKKMKWILINAYWYKIMPITANIQVMNKIIYSVCVCVCVRTH